MELLPASILLCLVMLPMACGGFPGRFASPQIEASFKKLKITRLDMGPLNGKENVYGVRMTIKDRVVIAHYDERAEKIVEKPSYDIDSIAFIDHPLESDGQTALSYGRILECVKGQVSDGTNVGGSVLYAARIFRFALNACKCEQCQADQPPIDGTQALEFTDPFGTKTLADASKQAGSDEFSNVLAHTMMQLAILLKNAEIRATKELVSAAADRSRDLKQADSSSDKSPEKESGAAEVTRIDVGPVYGKKDVFGIRFTTTNGSTKLARYDENGQTRWAGVDIESVAFVDKPLDTASKAFTVDGILDCIQGDPPGKDAVGVSVIYAAQALKFALNGCKCKHCQDEATETDARAGLEFTESGKALLAKAGKEASSKEFNKVLAQTMMQLAVALLKPEGNSEATYPAGGGSAGSGEAEKNQVVPARAAQVIKDSAGGNGETFQTVSAWYAAKLELVKRTDLNSLYAIKMTTSRKGRVLLVQYGIAAEEYKAIGSGHWKTIASLDRPVDSKGMQLTVGKFIDCVDVSLKKNQHRQVLFAIRMMRFAVNDCPCHKCFESNPVQGLTKQIVFTDYGRDLITFGETKKDSKRPPSATAAVAAAKTVSHLRSLLELAAKPGKPAGDNRRFTPELIKMQHIKKFAKPADIKSWIVAKLELVEADKPFQSRYLPYYKTRKAKRTKNDKSKKPAKNDDGDTQEEDDDIEPDDEDIKETPRTEYAIKFTTEEGIEIWAHFTADGEEYAGHMESAYPSSIAYIENPKDGLGKALTMGDFVKCVEGSDALKGMKDFGLYYAFRLLRFVTEDCVCGNCLETTGSLFPSAKLRLTGYGAGLEKQIREKMARWEKREEAKQNGGKDEKGKMIVVKEPPKPTEAQTLLLSLLVKYSLLFTESDEAIGLKTKTPTGGKAEVKLEIVRKLLDPKGKLAEVESWSVKRIELYESVEGYAGAGTGRHLAVAMVTDQGVTLLAHFAPGAIETYTKFDPKQFTTRLAFADLPLAPAVRKFIDCVQVTPGAEFSEDEAVKFALRLLQIAAGNFEWCKRWAHTQGNDAASKGSVNFQCTPAGKKFLQTVGRDNGTGTMKPVVAGDSAWKEIQERMDVFKL